MVQEGPLGREHITGNKYKHGGGTTRAVVRALHTAVQVEGCCVGQGAAGRL